MKRIILIIISVVMISCAHKAENKKTFTDYVVNLSYTTYYRQEKELYNQYLKTFPVFKRLDKSYMEVEYWYRSKKEYHNKTDFPIDLLKECEILMKIAVRQMRSERSK